MKKISLVICIIALFISSQKIKSQEGTISKHSKLIKKIEYFDANNGSRSLTEFFNKKENKTKLINHSEKYGDTEKTFSYDKVNNLIEEKEFDTKGELVETKFYEYKTVSDQEFLEFTYEKRKGSEKKLITEDKLEYNDDGNLFRKNHRTIYGNWTYNYKYHPNNKLKEEIILAHEETEKVIITYNEQGKREIEKIFRRKTKDDTFKLELTNQWYYDNDGNQVTNKGEIVKPNEAYIKKYTYHN